MNRIQTQIKNFLFVSLFLGMVQLVFSFQSGGTEAQRPNILIVMADDLTYRDLAVYGGQNVATPNIDRFASQSMIFDRAYVSMAMCTPSRAEFFTGKYPSSTGVLFNHSSALQDTKSIAHYLTSEDYRVGIAGKIHVKPKSVFAFEEVPEVERQAVAQTADFGIDGIKEFFDRSDTPFCLITAFTLPHSPWTVGKPEEFDKEKLQLPPYLVDTEETREAFAKYLAEIKVLDDQFGRLLKVLKESGKANNTIVIFTTEQGSQFPLNKWTNYEMGLHTGIMIRWHGNIPEGSRTNALVQYADMLPTLLDAIQINCDPTDFDGSSFLDVLLNNKEKHRKFAYALHHNTPEGPPYPIRSITDGEFRYIRNLNAEDLYIEKHVMGKMEQNPYWASWVFASARDSQARKIVNKYMKRSSEELYHTKKDPFEFDNLVDHEKYLTKKTELSAELDKWMTKNGLCEKEMDSWERYQESLQIKSKDEKK